MVSFLCRSCAHEWPQEETNKIYHCPECGYGYPEQEQASNQEQEPQPEHPTIHPESLAAIRHQEEKIAQLRRVIADYQLVAVGYEKELAEAKAAAGIAAEPQPEHLDTLDVLRAIVDAWRHWQAIRGIPVSMGQAGRVHIERVATLEQALEMGRRHLEQEEEIL